MLWTFQTDDILLTKTLKEIEVKIHLCSSMNLIYWGLGFAYAIIATKVSSHIIGVVQVVQLHMYLLDSLEHLYILFSRVSRRRYNFT